MSEEVIVAAPAETPAPVQVDTASPAPEVLAPAEVIPAEPKTFSQEDVDALVGKRLAREQRKWERTRQAEPPAVSAPVPPADQFASVEAYADALATQKAEQIVEQREAQKQQAAFLDGYREKEEEARDKYDDFQQVAYNPNLRITTVMAQTIQSSDIGPEVAYYLGANPKDADRISRLPALLQAKEIGRLEAKITATPNVKKTSSAPPPLSPVTARSTGNSTFDTTDPRAIKSMSTSEWIAADRQRQMKKAEASRLR